MSAAKPRLAQRSSSSSGSSSAQKQPAAAAAASHTPARRVSITVAASSSHTPARRKSAASSAASCSRSRPRAQTSSSSALPSTGDYVDSSGVPLTTSEILSDALENFKRSVDELHKEEPRAWNKETAANCDTCWNCNDLGDPEVLCCDGICRRSFHLECIGLGEMPEGAWFCPQCAEAEFPEPHCNENDPVGRSVLLCAIEDHKLRDDDDDPTAPKHAYLTHLLHTPRLQPKLQVNLRDKERGFNALHYAMIIHNQMPSDEIVRLVELGCDVNCPASLNPLDLNATPAHMALQQQEASIFLPLLTSPLINLKAKSGGSGVFVKRNPLNGDTRTGRQFKTNTWPIFLAFTLVFALREHLLVPKRSPTDADPTAAMDESASEESLGYSFPGFVREKLRVLDLKPLQFAYLMLRNPREGKRFSGQTFKECVTRCIESDRVKQERRIVAANKAAAAAGIRSSPEPLPEPKPNPFEGVPLKALHGRVVDEIMSLIGEQHQRQQTRFAPVETKDRVRNAVGTYARWTRAWEHIHGRPEQPASTEVASVKIEPKTKRKAKAISSSSAAPAAAAVASASADEEEEEKEADEEEEDEEEAEEDEEDQSEERKQADSPPRPRPRHRKPLPPPSTRRARSRGPIDEPPAVVSQSENADDDAEDDAGFQPEFDDAQMMSPEPVLSSPPAVASAVSPSPAPAAPAAAQSRKRRADESISASPVVPVIVASPVDRSLSAASSSSKRSKTASSTSPPILPPLHAADASADYREEEKSRAVPPPITNLNSSSPAVAAATRASAAYLACIPSLLEQTLQYRQLLARGVHSAADTAAIEAALAAGRGDSASHALDELTRAHQQYLTARQQLQQLLDDQRQAAALAARRWADSSQSMSVDSQAPPRQ